MRIRRIREKKAQEKKKKAVGFLSLVSIDLYKRKTSVQKQEEKKTKQRNHRLGLMMDGISNDERLIQIEF